jgi:predicted Zn-dependent protease
MRNAAYFRPVAITTLLLVTASCATTQLPPISSQGAGFKPLADEEQLWDQSRDEEKQLLEKVTLYEDPLLESYLTGVVTRLNTKGMAANPSIRYTVHVVEDPTLNAFAYPHGSLYVHTGLLARMENEDQLATVLGHEMTHVENRHMLRYQRAAHNKAIGLTVAAVAASVIVAGAEGDALDHGNWGQAAAIDVVGNLIVSLGLQLAFLASVNGYGRGLETEADDGGFVKLAAAGYRLGEAPKVYQALLDDRGEPKKMEAFFFGNHPRLSERIENSKHYLAAHPAAPSGAGTGDAEAFAKRIRPVIRDDARLNIGLGRFKLAESELEKVRAQMPEDPEARVLMGHLRLAQAAAEKDPGEQKRLRAEAGEALRDAVHLDPSRPDPHRELGLYLHDEKDFKGSCRELKRYVELARHADDTDRIRDYILELKKDGYCK